MSDKITTLVHRYGAVCARTWSVDTEDPAYVELCSAIGALEAEVAGMRPVVEAAVKWRWHPYVDDAPETVDTAPSQEVMRYSQFAAMHDEYEDLGDELVAAVNGYLAATAPPDGE